MLAALALELVYLAVTRARGAWLGAACGLGAAIWLSRIRISRRSLGAAVGAVAIAAVAAVLPGRFNPRDAGDAKRYSGLVQVLEGGFDAHSTALKTRLGLWRRSVTMIGDYPIAGVGPGNWPRVFPSYAEPHATRDGVLSDTLAPRQAHEDYLERAGETGIPGLLALGVLAFGVAVAARARLRVRGEDAHVVAGAAGAWVALGVLCFASFPLEMPGTLALSPASRSGFSRPTRPPGRRGPRPRWSATPRRRPASALLLALRGLVRSERTSAGATGSAWPSARSAATADPEGASRGSRRAREGARAHAGRASARSSPRRRCTSASASPRRPSGRPPPRSASSRTQRTPSSREPSVRSTAATRPQPDATRPPRSSFSTTTRTPFRRARWPRNDSTTPRRPTKTARGSPLLPMK